MLACRLETTGQASRFRAGARGIDSAPAFHRTVADNAA